MLLEQMIVIICFFLLVLTFVSSRTRTKRVIRAAQITDTHIGENCNGNLSYEACKSVRNLFDAVEKINLIEPPIDIVIVTGDITSSALLSEFQEAYDILKKLEMPWFPILGNHDSWPYEQKIDGSFNQTDTPIGDEYFAQMFSDQLTAGTKGPIAVVSDWPGQACLNGDFGYQTYHHNFMITFPDAMDNLIIFGLDWVARQDALPEPGVGPEAELHDYECGTIEWLQHRLESLLNSSTRNSNHTRFFIAQHHPFHNREEFSLAGQNLLYNFTFDEYQNQIVQETFQTYFRPESILGITAGHTHRWSEGFAWTQSTAIDVDWMNVPEYQTSACKGWVIDEEFASAFTVFEFAQEYHYPILLKTEMFWKLPNKEWSKRVSEDEERHDKESNKENGAVAGISKVDAKLERQRDRDEMRPEEKKQLLRSEVDTGM